MEIYSISKGTCDEASLIRFLGGIPNVDLLGSGISITPVEDADNLCSVTREDGLPTSTLEGIWNDNNNNGGYFRGGEFRRCYSYQNQPISCDEPHRSEVIYEGNQQVDCRAQYQSFAHRSPDSDTNIKITGYAQGNIFTCAVEVQTNRDSLVHSVRNLNDLKPKVKSS